MDGGWGKETDEGGRGKASAKQLKTFCCCVVSFVAVFRPSGTEIDFGIDFR